MERTFSIPDVSVIIPNYNGAIFLSAAIDSALSQAEVNVEVIVVDDGSTDSSMDIINNYGDQLVSVYHDKNQSASAARNSGLKVARSEYIKFLDSDDVLLDGALKSQCGHLLRVLEDYPSAASCGWYETATSLNFNKAKLIRQSLEGNRVSSIIRYNQIPGSVLYRREDLLRLGGFSEAFRTIEEYELNVRLALEGVVFVPLLEPVFKQRVHDSPDRLSNRRYEQHGIDTWDAITQGHIRLALEKFGKPLPLELAEAFAWRYWEVGRAFLREENVKSAKLFFERAQQLSPNTRAGGRLYRALARSLSPWALERVHGYFRRYIP